MRRALLVLGSALALCAIAVLWLASTGGGLRWLAGRIENAVPGLVLGHVDGSLFGGVDLQGVRWGDAQQKVSIAALEFRIDWRRSLAGAPCAERLVLRGVHYARAQDAMPQHAGADRPLTFPALRVDSLAVEDATLVLGTRTFTLARATATLELGARRIALEDLQMAGEPLSASGALSLDLERPYALDALSLKTEFRDGDGPTWRGRLSGGSAAERTQLALALEAPLTAQATLTWAADGRLLDATLLVPDQDGTALGLPGPLGAGLRLVAQGEALAPSGNLALAQHRMDVVGGTLRVDADALLLAALDLSLPDHGRIQIDGRMPFAAEEPLALYVRTDDLRLPRTEAAALSLRGQVAIAGPRAQATIAPELTLAAPGLPEARIEGRATWTFGGLRLDGLRLRTASGSVQVDGVYAARADSALRAQFAAFDPALFAADWPGRIDADLVLAGRLVGGRPRGRIHLLSLSGNLRGAPLAGRGELAVEGFEPGPGRIDLRWGDASLRATIGTEGAGALRIELPGIGLLLPGAAGSAHLALQRGADDRLEASIEGYTQADARIDRARIQANLGRGAEAGLRFGIDAANLRWGSLHADRLRLTVQGRRRAHTLRLELNAGDRLAVDVAAEGGADGARWHGRWTQAQIEAGGERAELAAPVAVALTQGQVQLESACWRLLRGEACVRATGDRSQGEAEARWSGLSLGALRALVPALPVAEVEGLIDGQATLRWRAGRLDTAAVQLSSTRGLARLPQREDLDLGYRGLDVALRYADGAGRLEAGAELIPAGRVELEAILDSDAAGRLGWDAVLGLTLTDLSFIEGFTTALADPVGDLRGQLRIQGGSRPQSVSGALALTDFTAIAPAQAIRLRDGVLAVAGVPGQLIVRGSVRSGDGTLAIDGRILPGDPVPARLVLYGQNVRLANTPTLMLIASPELELELRDGRWWLDGALVIPRARIDAARLEAAVQASADVVVVDDPAAAEPARPWQARVRVELGDAVRLSGFGFDGSIAGRLDIRQRQGARALATGEILLAGRYEAYGQRLNITRGALRYANSPLSEPSIDLRAERTVREQTVALEVTGSVLAPQTRVVGSGGSDAEALALLVTGRPLAQIGADDRQPLAAAATALGVVGADLLARQLRGRLGLDELGVRNDTQLDGEVFTLGKFLSPRLYVGYGIGLITRGELFTVRYLLTDRVDLEASRGDSTRAAMNWRFER